jgi:hypothetical protein
VRKAGAHGIKKNDWLSLAGSDKVCQAIHMTSKLVARPHGILWEGRSLIDDAPIVAIATAGSANRKTGPMIQVWIVRSDVAPHVAKRAGQDVSVCGHCAMRDACYVVTAHAPRSAWEAYNAGLYGCVEPQAFARSVIRWGAYGDPALLPAELVHACNAVSRGWTGYTHLYKRDWAQWCRGVFMASVETAAQEERLRAQGWGTFRVGLKDASDVGSATHCPYDTVGTTCIECRACDGGERAIYVSAHGAGANAVPAERLRRRSLARRAARES